MKYISVYEYLMGRAKIEDLTDEQLANMNTLIPKVNELLEKFGEYKKCNSGFRSINDHLRIYKEINEKRKKQGKPEVKVPMSSSHLKAAAIDLEDKNDKLKNWILKNVHVLEELDLYCESFSHTDTWVHLQIFKPKSGNRFFIP
jgi:hypothetical protein